MEQKRRKILPPCLYSMWETEVLGSSTVCTILDSLGCPSHQLLILSLVWAQLCGLTSEYWSTHTNAIHLLHWRQHVKTWKGKRERQEHLNLQQQLVLVGFNWSICHNKAPSGHHIFPFLTQSYTWGLTPFLYTLRIPSSWSLVPLWCTMNRNTCQKRS